MLHVGLTGGIASGKSTVAAMMRQRDCQVLEADMIARRLIEPDQPACDEILREFGEQVCAPGGGIARQKLAAIVFADPAKLQRLNRIVHPRVVEVLDHQLAEIERTHRGAVVVVEAALLIESSYSERLDRLVVAWCRPEQQIARLLTRGMTREEARQRIAAQMDLAQKRRMADDEVDCSGSLEHTERQVEALVAKLKTLAAAGNAKGQAEG